MAKVAIIGGGASGLVAAIYASLKNDVTIFEKNSKCGKKILVTGNGKCNYWNEDFSSKYFNSTNGELLDNIINEKNKVEIMSFFNRIGIIPVVKDGYYYPMSLQAVSIQMALLKEIDNRGVKIKNNSNVIDINYNGKYEVVTDSKVYEFDKVIVSTGSYANSDLKDSLGYKIFSKFKHNVIPVVPALVKLNSLNFILKEAAGVRCDVKVTLIENKKQTKEEFGQLQITKDGLSGICIYQLSSKVARGISEGKKEEIKINFLPWLKDDFIKFMDDRNKKVKNRTIADLLDGILNYKVVNKLLKLSKISNDDRWDNIDKKAKEVLRDNIKGLIIKIDSTNGFKDAQTCSGGIPLNEIDLNKMESLKQKGLYITGEIIDVDGLCGGYNLGVAWITGMIAGKSV